MRSPIETKGDGIDGERWGRWGLGALFALTALVAIENPAGADSLRPDADAVPLGGTLRLHLEVDPGQVGMDAVLYRGSTLGPSEMGDVPVPVGGRVREVLRIPVQAASVVIPIPIPDNPLLNGRGFCLTCVVEGGGEVEGSSNAVSFIVQGDTVFAGVVPHPETMGFENLDELTTQNLRAVSFPTETTGYFAGGGPVLLKTVDGGASVQEIDVTGGAPISLTDVQFLDEDRGFVLGTFFSGVVYRTSDGGANWDRALVPGKLNAVDFLDRSVGYVAGQPYNLGSGGPISKTVDGGVTWTSQANEVQTELMDVRFADAQLGYAVGRFGTVLKTTNGGGLWSTVELPPAYRDLWLMAVEVLGDGETVFVVGANGVILASNDGGRTFRRVPSRTRETLRSVAFYEDRFGWITGDHGTLLHTFDGGRTWVPYDSFYEGHRNADLILGVALLGPDRAVAVGYDGMIGVFRAFHRQR